MMSVNLYYPFKDLNGVGRQLIVLSGSRGVWWLSKCVWTVINTVINYLIIFASSTICGLIFGAKLSMHSNSYLWRVLSMSETDITSTTTWNITSVFFTIGFALIVLALLQLLLSLIAKPMLSFFFMAAYLFAATYMQNPALYGNYAIGARSSVLVTTGLSGSVGVLIGAWIIMICVSVGFFVFQFRDILNSD